MDRLPYGVLVAGQGRLADPFEVLLEVGADHAVVGHVDLLVVGGGHAFLRGEQFLVKFLAPPQAGEGDRDILARFEAREADQVAGEVQNLHGFAHVEDVHGTVLGLAPRLEDELGGLGDGHEVAGHLGMGHGDGASPADLLPEGGHHAAPAAQDVAEADRDEGLVFLAPVGGILHDLLGDALAGPHDRGGVHGLVGADVDEARHAVFQGQFHEVAGAEHVVEEGLVGVFLHHGHVLVGGGVEDDVGQVQAEKVRQALFVAYVADEHLEVELGMAGDEFLLDVEEAVLAPAQKQDLFGAEAGHLADDLAADGAARAGDEDGLADEIAGDGARVQADGVAPEEVFQVDLPDLGNGDIAREDLVNAGDDAVLEFCLLGQADDAADHVAGGRGNGDEDDFGARFPGHVGKVGNGAPHLQAHVAFDTLAGVVVQEGHGDHAGLGVAKQFADDDRAGLSRPHDEGAFGGSLDAFGLCVLEAEANGKPQAAEDDDGEEGLDQRDASGDTEGRLEGKGQARVEDGDGGNAEDEVFEVAH